MEKSKNELKKALYREKPEARLLSTIDGVFAYEANLIDGTEISFNVPVTDMGDAKFESRMPAQLLIRWM